MTTAARQPGLSRWLPGYVADEMRPEMVENWVQRTQVAIETELGHTPHSNDLRAILREAIEQHWLAFLAALTQPDEKFHLVDAGERLARETAMLQFPVELLIKFYRTALQETWSYITGVVNAIPPGTADPTEVLIYFWGRASRWIDASIGMSIDVYHAEKARASASTSAQHFETVREILAGHDVDVRKASTTLGGYPLSAYQTAFIVDTSDSDAVSELAGVGGEIGRALDRGRSLVIHPGGRQVWVWVATRGLPDLARMSEVEVLARKHRVRVFAGMPSQGVGGFVTTFEDAERIRDVAQRASEPHGLVRYDHHEVIVLLGCRPEVDRFVERTLGELMQPDENTARLRETVAAYLERAGSVEEAAKDLCVHRNTVRYRLSRAEEVLGRPVMRNGPELLVALRHHSAFHSGQLGSRAS